MDILKSAAAYAPLATATLAFIALIVAAVQIYINKSVQKDVRVKNLYARFVEVSLSNADITRLKLADYDHRNFEDDERLFRIKYSWYVSYAMDVCEEIWLIKPDQSWINTIKYQVESHVGFLNSKYFKDNRFADLYNPKFAAFVMAVVREGELGRPA